MVILVVFNSFNVVKNLKPDLVERQKPPFYTTKAFMTLYLILEHLLVVSTTFLLVCFLSQKQSTCETRKSVFYFSSKAFFVFKKIKV